MAEFYEVNDCIESEKCEVIARKVVPNALFVDPVLGRCMKYDFSRNATAKILQSVDPKVTKKHALANLNVDDLLKAESIYALVSSFKKLKADVINESGRHKANYIIVPYFSFAQIKYPLMNVLNSMVNRGEIGERKD